MGKGDKKSRKGKIFMGSYGNTRPQKSMSRNDGNQSKEESDKDSKSSKNSKA